MNDRPNQQQSTTFRAQVGAALAVYRVESGSKFSGPFYFPSDFREPERQQFISLKASTDDDQTLYPNLGSFWVDTLFDFLEVQLRDEIFERQISEAGCEPVDEMTLRQQINECFQRLKPQFKPQFTYDGEPVEIYRMFNSATRVSFALRSTINYYAFFWESVADELAQHQE